MKGRRQGPGLDTLERVAAQFGAELEESSLLDGHARQASFRKEKQHFVWASNGTDLYLSIPTPKVAVRLALGRPDWNPDTPVYRVFGTAPLYLDEPVDDGNRPFIEATRRWLEEPANVALIERLDLKRGEWALFGANWTVAQLRSQPGDVDFDRVDVVLQIIEAATDPSAPWLREPRMNAMTIPEQFRDLIPFVRKWAIDDDTLRSERMVRARTKSLLELWNAVEPRLGAIDDYLDREGDEATYEALKIGRLAEATVEAGIELKARGIDRNSR